MMDFTCSKISSKLFSNGQEGFKLTCHKISDLKHYALKILNEITVKFMFPLRTNRLPFIS